MENFMPMNCIFSNLIITAMYNYLKTIEFEKFNFRIVS